MNLYSLSWVFTIESILKFNFQIRPHRILRHNFDNFVYDFLRQLGLYYRDSIWQRRESFSCSGGRRLKMEGYVEKISRGRLERVARMYKSNKEASQALGISLGGFGRACRRYGIDTPYVRNREQRNRKSRFKKL